MIVLEKNALLQTPARILVENETHAVIAVRVEKKMISSNLAFLATLADLVLAPSQHIRA